MTDDREFWRATTDWLEAGSDRTPPPAIDAVLLAVRTTRQDRPLPIAWRPPTMPPIARVLIAAAVVVALSLFAINTLVPGGVAVPPATPTPTPTTTPLAMPTGVQNPGPTLQAGARYATADPFPVRLSFTAPADWVGNEGGPYAVFAGPSATGRSVSFQRSLSVFADPCHPEQGAIQPSPGPSAADLVQAITGRPLLAKTTPFSTTLGGLPATTFRLSLGQSIRDCTNGAYQLWELPLGATEELLAGSGERVWVVDTASGPLVITADDDPAASSADRLTIQQVLDSIEIDSGS